MRLNPTLALLIGLSALSVCQAQAADNSSAAPITSTAQTTLVWRAVSRIAYGPTANLLAQVQAAPSPQTWALQQIDLAHTASLQQAFIASDLTDFNADLPGLFAAAKQERELRLKIKPGKATAPQSMQQDMDATNERRMVFSHTMAPEFFSRRVTQQTAAWRLGSCSQPELENPLLARMTEFWFNHLNVYIGKGAVRPYVGHYLLNVIRANALGKFEDLLLASAHHPAMLLYLDQAQSVAEGSPGAQGKTRGLNENYARELMELHTLGVKGGYSQTDVHELARILTGWTIGPAEKTGFRFAPRLHDTGTKQLLGQTFPSTPRTSGEQEGIDAIRLLARQAATAQRVSLRLAQFFVADTPNPKLVNALAHTFMDSQGDMRAVMQTLLTSADFWAAENQLFKTPIDFVCSALTATQNPDNQDRRGLVLAAGYLANAGQPLHGWQTPDGYVFDAATWLAPEALTRRADFALGLTRQTPSLVFLKPYLSANTLNSIDHERPALQAGLMLASPDFMRK
jgi:uncharacterized protein (DUF1800 family)